MSRLSTVEARNDFATLVNRVAFGKERVRLMRRGREIAAVVPLEDLELLERLIELQEDREDRLEAQAALEEAEREGTVSLDELKRELGL